MGERDRDLPDAAERRARLATWLLVPSWSALLGILLTWGWAKLPRLIQLAARLHLPPFAAPDSVLTGTRTNDTA